MIALKIVLLKLNASAFFADAVAHLGQSCVLPKHGFFFLPPWWEYLHTNIDQLQQCSVTFNFPNDLLAVGLAVIDIMLRLAGLAAVIGIIIAGLQHQFTGGNPEKAATARRRLYNALIGLAIALTATAAVSFVGRQLSN